MSEVQRTLVGQPRVLEVVDVIFGELLTDQTGSLRIVLPIHRCGCSHPILSNRLETTDRSGGGGHLFQDVRLRVKALGRFTDDQKSDADQGDAEGFINLFGLPLKVRALVDKQNGMLPKLEAPDYSDFKRD